MKLPPIVAGRVGDTQVNDSALAFVPATGNAAQVPVFLLIDPFTIDPAGTWSFNDIANLVGNWVDISENPGGLQYFAHWWANGPGGIATSYVNAPQFMHGDFFGSMNYLNSANLLPSGLNWPH